MLYLSEIELMKGSSYFVYEHKRKDNNDIFYVGIGTKKDCEKPHWIRTIYGRAYHKSGRSSEWHTIVNQTDYDINIVFETTSRVLACLKEIELIAFYGRADLDKGTLVNHTNGGDWDIEEHDFSYKLGALNPAARKILQYSLKGEFIKEWEYINKAIETLGLKETKVRDCVRLNNKKNYEKDRYRSSEGFIWLYHIENYPKKLTILETDNGSWKRSNVILQFNLEGDLVQKWQGSDAASTYLNVDRSNIQNGMKSENRQSRGFFWIKEKDHTENSFGTIRLYETTVNNVTAYFPDLTGVKEFVYQRGFNLSMSTICNMSAKSKYYYKEGIRIDSFIKEVKLNYSEEQKRQIPIKLVGNTKKTIEKRLKEIHYIDNIKH